MYKLKNKVTAVFHFLNKKKVIKKPPASLVSIYYLWGRKNRQVEGFSGACLGSPLWPLTRNIYF